MKKWLKLSLWDIKFVFDASADGLSLPSQYFINNTGM